MRIRELTMDCPGDRRPHMRRFYSERLGLQLLDETPSELVFAAGAAQLRFHASQGGEPFYHYALLLSWDGFATVRAEVSRAVPLLPDPDTGDVVFDFASWGAQACYFHDPAGNIVELIAHRDVEAPTGAGGLPAALLGISEAGLVVRDATAAAGELRAGLGLEVWDGNLEDPRDLLFVGEKAHTLILAPERRGWLPTRRPATVHPLEVLLSGGPPGRVHLTGLPYEITAGGGDQ